MNLATAPAPQKALLSEATLCCLIVVSRGSDYFVGFAGCDPIHNEQVMFYGVVYMFYPVVGLSSAVSVLAEEIIAALPHSSHKLQRNRGHERINNPKQAHDNPFK